MKLKIKNKFNKIILLNFLSNFLNYILYLYIIIQILNLSYNNSYFNNMHKIRQFLHKSWDTVKIPLSDKESTKILIGGFLIKIGTGVIKLWG